MSLLPSIPEHSGSPKFDSGFAIRLLGALDRSCRIAHHSGTGSHIACNDRAGADDGTVPHSYARQKNCAAAYPDLFADAHRQRSLQAPPSLIEPVGMVGTSATLMVVTPAVKANNAKELVAELKAAPDKTSYASAGNGTAPHFAAEMFKLSTGTSMLHVPYEGSAPAITDTIGGQN